MTDPIGRDFGMMLSVIGDGKGGARQGGMVFRDGVYDLIETCVLESDWDDNDYQTALRAKVKTAAGKTYEVTGRVVSLIPLRNRRTDARRPGAADADHRGHDRISLRRPGRATASASTSTRSWMARPAAARPDISA